MGCDLSFQSWHRALFFLPSKAQYDPKINESQEVNLLAVFPLLVN